MSDKDGGPAFPGVAGQDGYGHMTRAAAVDETPSWVIYSQGMTLWDYFAAAALQGLECENFEQFSHMANDAACIADAMLAERKKRGIGT